MFISVARSCSQRHIKVLRDHGVLGAASSSCGHTGVPFAPPTFLALRPMRCSVKHLMKGLRMGMREAHDLSSS